jgi:predicted dehydrogenase
MKTDFGGNILVVGAGSIGRRHLRNLRALGVETLAACDPASNNLAEAVKESSVEAYDDFGQALQATRPEVVFVCTPPVSHVSIALQAVRHGAHVFIEKPLSNELEGVDELIGLLRTTQRVAQVGYNLRFHPGLQKVKELVDKGTIGRVLWARIEAGQYLPDWRPGRDYRLNYTARRDQGGGIILDGSHELDYAIWIMGRPSEVQCMAGRVSSLETDVEDCATLLLRFETGAQADVHMDFVQRGYARACKIAGEDGSVLWDYEQNHVRVYRAASSSWDTLPYNFHPNDMYVAEVEHFLQCVVHEGKPEVDLDHAKLVLEVAVAAKLAAASGSRIAFSS